MTDRKNVLLVIVDCLRYDKTDHDGIMPFLYKWGEEHAVFTNHRSVSHCTDPSITSMLTGLHPDSPRLRLYSMMYGADFTIPEDVVMLPQVAQEYGFATCMISNLSRWYRRGQDFYVDCRGWPGRQIFNEAIKQVANLPEPWFMIVHDDSCHTNYEGGSYDAACGLVDSYIKALIEATSDEETWIFVTADHGEGLGETTVSGRVVEQHGFGLDAFLTHVPLLTNACLSKELVMLSDNGLLHSYLHWLITDEGVGVVEPFAVFQAGATPKFFHRGVVWPDGRQFIRETSGNNETSLSYVGDFTDAEKAKIEGQLIDHCERHGIRYGNEDMDPRIVRRLKGLGYFD